MAFEDETKTNANELSGDTNPPYVQFEKCRHAMDSDAEDKFVCKYLDNNGYCIHETCVYDNTKPPRTRLWYYTCLICKREDTARPEELRAPFCHKCVERMQEVEQLPHNCRICGKAINQPAKWMFSGICDECTNNIASIVNHWKTKGPWVS